MDCNSISIVAVFLCSLAGPLQDGAARRGREVPLQSAPVGVPVESQKPAVEARLWVVAFDADLPADKLPIRPNDIDGVARELGRGKDEKGRVPTWGLAVQNEIEKFEITAGSHRLRVRDGALVSEPVDSRPERDSSESSAPPWTFISAPRLLVNLGQEAMVAVGRPVEYMTRGDDGCLRVETIDGVTEGMELHLTASKILEKGIRFTGVQLKVTRVESRQPIDGVPFDVGRPIMDTRETQLDITLDDGRIAIMPLPTRAGEPAIIVFLLAHRVEK